MFSDYVLKLTSAEYKTKILIIDHEDFEGKKRYSSGFESHGFTIVYYKSDLLLRAGYEDQMNNPDWKLLLIADASSYIPYDIQKKFHVFELSLASLFPKMNTEILRKEKSLDLDLLVNAYQKNFNDYSFPQQTKIFISQHVYGTDNVEEHLNALYSCTLKKCNSAKNYYDWMNITGDKARIDVMAAQHHIKIDSSEFNRKFKDFILTKFGGLSSELNRETPVLVSRAMEYMHGRSDKFIVIVMDGMSAFDWEIISESFHDIRYKKTWIYAMIPSTTSVSRQCLLSNKYPSQLLEPWKQSKEKQEFIFCAKNMGYEDKQIGYERGYDADFSPIVRCGAVIINEVDEIVHAQRQGRQGMLNDITLLADQGKLALMVRKFTQDGYDVYITADHGNTPCIGMGKLTRTGVDVETKSHRMVVLQDFADKNSLQERFHLIDYPKFYLDKKYDYLICDVGISLDAKGEEVMTHGGISIDEVIVPFIQIKAVDGNG